MNSGTLSISGFSSQTAIVDGVQLHYRLGGDPAGPPVLLWHGFLGTSYTWRKVMPQLIEAGLAVLVPDMRGYGDSDKPGGTDGYDGRALAKEFRSLVRQIGFGQGRPITLVAHDMGAPPALLWAAAHPDEVAGLMYLDEPVMLTDLLTALISYTPRIAGSGGMWWWPLALAPDIPERLIVDNERAFLTWFFDRASVTPGAIESGAIDEYLRTFRGPEGVLGALGVYRASFVTQTQTALLSSAKVQIPVVALGAERGLSGQVLDMINLVADHATGGIIRNCGHFIPEEQPDEVVRQVIGMIRPPH
ncbi:alpha/beta hydrolase [Deinococcus sp. Arct2-2]|uniref:alpha/beta fold hydrolase n=1 Tax=Deinococcus sp. Arct2-2 TaxID=2568653 RepID=UPI0010A2F9B8|nr:alpha/beta hydrolase [Deinococcus sp. Arct2-2]THF69583.1 alpha/beta hydrolase [Deinococcus sp. Arct2-2]